MQLNVVQLLLIFCIQFIEKRNIVYKMVGLFISFISIFSNVNIFIDYQLSFNGPSTPFLRFDNVTEEFIFEIKTKSFVEDDFSLGEKLLSNK